MRIGAAGFLSFRHVPLSRRESKGRPMACLLITVMSMAGRPMKSVSQRPGLLIAFAEVLYQA